MKYLKLILFTLLVALAGCDGNSDFSDKDYSSEVNPFIGTVGSGNTFLGVVMPYGMMQLGLWQGYAKDGESGTIYGFSHTHVSGMAGGGNGSRGSVVFMPAINRRQKSFVAKFKHENETASPDFYSTVLDDYNIKVELTATTRAGIHRYIFPESDSSAIVLKIANGSVTINDNEISGVDNGVWFAAKFNKPVEDLSLWGDGSGVKDFKSLKGKNRRVVFGFKTKKDEEVLLKVGISMVSKEGAANNLEKEIPGWDFNSVRNGLREKWNSELGKIDVEGGTKDDRVIFYTSLYHAMLHPNIYMDVDRKYRGSNGNIYTADEFDNYTNFSLWDTFRALHPLYTLINVKMTSQFIRTFLARYETTGRMLIMEFNGVEGSQPPMIAYHSLSVLADAYVKGIRDYDVPKAYTAMKHLANDLDRKGKRFYLDYGYIPSDLKGQTVSRTLEYSYDDWCVTRFAKDFNKEDLLYYSQRGDFYKNLFLKDVNFMVGRKSNFKFVDDFDPMETTGHYTEANAYQYSTFVPQDVQGLIQLMGGDEAFDRWLDDCFSTETDFSKINVRDVTGLIGQYAHGNEPSHSIAYLYNYAGSAWKTQKMVRQILSDLYENTQGGIDGNEDCGQMSAWYVLSAMGIYQVTPGLDYFVIGSPVFDKITLNLENGNRFEIVANNNGKESVYIQSAKLNGKDYKNSYLKYADIMKGGKLVFEMGNTPNKKWGRAKENQPYPAEERVKFASSPILEFDDIMFLNKMPVKMAGKEAGARIYYTTDGTNPTDKSTLYTGTVDITKPTTLKCRTYVEGIYPSYPLTVNFKQIPMLEAVEVSGLKPGVVYLYREGPKVMCARDQADAPIVDKGILKTFNVDKIKDDRPFGYNLYGYIKVSATGVYIMTLEANDGAILYLDGKEIIDNDGGHRSQILETKIGLKKGWHKINVDYFQQGLAKNLILTWEGPGVTKQVVPVEVLFHKPE